MPLQTEAVLATNSSVGRELKTYSSHNWDTGYHARRIEGTNPVMLQLHALIASPYATRSMSCTCGGNLDAPTGTAVNSYRPRPRSLARGPGPLSFASQFKATTERTMLRGRWILRRALAPETLGIARRRASTGSQAGQRVDEEWFKRRCDGLGLNASTPVLVALSGGVDSMALCHMAAQVRASGEAGKGSGTTSRGGRQPSHPSIGCLYQRFDTVHAVTVDHGLREGSSAEAQLVREQFAAEPVSCIPLPPPSPWFPNLPCPQSISVLLLLMWQCLCGMSTRLVGLQLGGAPVTTLCP